MRWHRPLTGSIKINLDGSLKNSSTASGFIVHYWTSKLVQVGAPYFGDASIVVAEVRALRDGINLVVPTILSLRAIARL